MVNFALSLLLVAATDTAGPAHPSIEDLKLRYLDCERRAQSARLPGSDAALCSETYEALKLRAFGGDFRRLNEWYRRASPATAAPGQQVSGQTRLRQRPAP
jgi:hypothetical protein